METLDWVYLALTRPHSSDNSTYETRRRLLDCYTHLLHQDLTEERRLDFLFQALWTQSSAPDSTLPLSDALPFERLSDRDRILLGWAHSPEHPNTSLVQRGWTLARIGRILGISTNEVEEQLWSARCRLHDWAKGVAPQNQLEWIEDPTWNQDVLGVASGPECPLWETRAPWTQRWLDGMGATAGRTRESAFLQSHLARCRSCRARLDYTRQTFATCQAEVTRALVTSSTPPVTADLNHIQKLHQTRHTPPNQVLDSLVRFIRRPERRPAILIWGIVVIAWAFAWLFH